MFTWPVFFAYYLEKWNHFCSTYEASTCSMFLHSDSSGVTAWQGKAYLLVSLIIGIDAAVCAGICVCVCVLPLVYTQSESPASTAHTLGSKTDAGFALGVKSYYPYQRGASLKTRRHEAASKSRWKQSLKRKLRVGWERCGNEGCWTLCVHVSWW